MHAIKFWILCSLAMIMLYKALGCSADNRDETITMPGPMSETCFKMSSGSKVCEAQAECRWYVSRSQTKDKGFCDLHKISLTECSDIKHEIFCDGVDYIKNKNCIWLAPQGLKKGCFEKLSSCSAATKQQCQSAISALLTGSPHGCVFDEKKLCIEVKANCQALSLENCTVKGAAANKSSPFGCFINKEGNCDEVKPRCAEATLVECTAQGAVDKKTSPLGCFFDAEGKCADKKSSCDQVDSANCTVPGAAKSAHGCFINHGKKCADKALNCSAILQADCLLPDAAKVAPNGCALTANKTCVERVASCDLIANPISNCNTPDLTTFRNGCIYNAAENLCLNKITDCTDLNPNIINFFTDLSDLDRKRCETPGILTSGLNCTFVPSSALSGSRCKN